jgi:SPP1 family predicted phage head-tail adaptor
MQAGYLDQRITLQARSASRDAMGGEVVTWADVATVWAAAEPLRGREYFAAQQVQAETQIRFRIRYRAGIVLTMRVLWRAQPYDIQAVIDPYGRKTSLELMCSTAGVRDGG